MIRFLVVVVLAVGLLAPGTVFAVDPAPRISDHEIIEGLADLNAKYTELKAELRRVVGYRVSVHVRRGKARTHRSHPPCRLSGKRR